MKREQKRMWYRVLIIGAALTLGGAAASAAQAPQGGTPAPKPPAAANDAKNPPAAKKDFTLRISKGAPHIFNLKAKNARLADVVGEMSRRLQVPVKLSRVMSEQRINVEADGLPLEPTLRLLAPHPYVDYVSGGEDQFQPKVLAVYLYAMNETPPSLNDTVKSQNEALLIEGDTEEGTEEYEAKKKDAPLAVSFANNRLSVRARKQPLSVVLAKIASELGIPFELNSDSTEVVDLEFNGLAVDQAIRTLSPTARFFYRADLLNSESYPIRLALTAPSYATPGKAQDKN